MGSGPVEESGVSDYPEFLRIACERFPDANSMKRVKGFIYSAWGADAQCICADETRPQSLLLAHSVSFRAAARMVATTRNQNIANLQTPLSAIGLFA